MKPYKDILKMKNPDEMFNLLIAFIYFAGKFDMNIPVDESREIFEAIKKRLRVDK